MEELNHDIFEIGDTPERQVPTVADAALQAWGIWAAGLSDAGAGYSMVRLLPPTGHLIICYGGKGQVWHQEAWRDLGAGMAYLTPPQQPMAFRTVDGHRWQFSWMYLLESDKLIGTIDSSKIMSIDPRQVIAALEGLYVESSGVGSIERIELWAELVHTYTDELLRSAGSPDPLWKLWADIDASLSDDWTLLRLAEKADMQAEALRRLCLLHHGRSPMKHVTFLRMRRAEALLRTTTIKLSSIARQVGYRNAFAFSTAYSRWKGRPPKSFRANSDE